MARRRLLPSLHSLVRVTDAASPATEILPVIDDAFTVRVLDLAIRIGETMLVAGAPASEVASTIVRVAGTYGLDPVHVDVTYNSITVAHHRSGADKPVTLMRVVRGSAPDHARLQRLQALVTDIRAGVALDEAAARFRTIRRTPFGYHQPVVITSQALLAVGVAVMFGGNWLVIALSFVAAGAAALTQSFLARARVPFFFSQIAGAFVLTLVAATVPPLLQLTGWDAAEAIRPTVIVASGIVLMLAGSIVGIVVAYRLHVPSVAITTAAILPLVPGAAVFRGLLGIVEAEGSAATLLTGFSTLASAATIGIALAVGASLGIYLGQPLRASLGSVIRSRARLRV
ncbi:threonine/serine exporter family protein [Microbacterium marinum]|uniref:threonine/serine exporter family protein n=1 Tax=Microbacterium marinum TaxID=421115 RepID=UPI00384C07B1